MRREGCKRLGLQRNRKAISSTQCAKQEKYIQLRGSGRSLCLVVPHIEVHMIPLTKSESHWQSRVNAHRRAVPHEEIATAKVLDDSGLLLCKRARALRSSERCRGRAGERPVVIVILLVVHRKSTLRGGVHRRRRGHCKRRAACAGCRYRFSCRCGSASLVRSFGIGICTNVAQSALKTILARKNLAASCFPGVTSSAGATD